MSDFLTFKDIYEAVMVNMGDMQQVQIDQVKALVNMVYLNEVMVCDDLYPMHWLLEEIDNVKTKDSATITGITSASPPVVTAAAHGFEDGDIVQISDIEGMTEVNNRLFLVDNKTVDTLELQTLDGVDVVGAGYATYASGGTIRHRGITLAKAFSKIYSMAWHGYNGQTRPISPIEIEQTTSWMDSATTGRPTRHLLKPSFSAVGVKTDKLLWFPLPDDNYHLRLWGEVDVAPMSDVAHVPQLPFKFHNTIVSGAIARLVQYGQVQIENAVIWPGLYKMQIEAIKTYNREYWKQFDSEARSKPYLL